MPLRTLLTTLAFGLTYLAISGLPLPGLPRRRSSSAFVGAAALVALGALSPLAALRAIDLPTLGLLLGMMLVAGALRLSGAAAELATLACRRFGGRPRALLWLVTALSGVLSALLVNDAVCLILTPIVLELCDRGRLRPLPYLLALATGANVGSVATLTGNPQNMIVGLRSAWPYLGFFARLGPIAALGLFVTAAILDRLFSRAQLEATPDLAVPSPPPEPPDPAWRALRGPLLVTFAGVILGFAAGLDLAWVALAGGGVALLLAGRRARELAAEVDLSLLVFFASLFVVVAGFNATGLPRAAFTLALPAFGHTVGRQLASFSAFSLAASNAFSNVPFVVLAAPWIQGFADPRLMWLALAATSTLAGNLTLVGSMANMIVAEEAAPRLRISFWDYARVGVPVTLATSALAVAGLWLGG